MYIKERTVDLSWQNQNIVRQSPKIQNRRQHLLSPFPLSTQLSSLIDASPTN